MDLAKGQSRDATTLCTAFAGVRRIASGPLPEVALALRQARGTAEADAIVVVSDTTGEILLDWRGSDEDIRRRLADAERVPGAVRPTASAISPQPPRGRGRPKLGVVSREVTMLPIHWEWLAQQPGGTSVALRKVVDRILASEGESARAQQRAEAAHRFITALASELPGFAGAARAFLAQDREQFLSHAATWPTDIREHALVMAFGDAA